MATTPPHQPINTHPSGWRVAGVLVIVALAVWALARAGTTPCLVFPDEMEYAQVARSLVQHHRLTINTMRLPQLAAGGPFPQHNVHRLPGWPLFLAPWMLLLGTTDAAPVLVGSLLTILLVPFSFFVTRKIFPEPVAIATALTLALQRSQLFYGYSGLSEPLFCFWVWVVWHALFRWRPTTVWSLLAMGALFAMGQWVRSNALLFVPAGVWWVWRTEDDHKPHLTRWVYVCVGWLIVMAPLMVYYRTVADECGVAGVTQYAVNQVGDIPSHGAERMLRPPSPFDHLARHPWQTLTKLWRNLTITWDTLSNEFPFWLGGFWFVGLILEPDPRRKRWALTAGGVFVAHIVLLCQGDFEGSRLYVPMLGVLLPSAWQGWWLVTQRVQCVARGWLVRGMPIVLLALVAGGAVNTIAGLRASQTPVQSLWRWQFGQQLQSVLPADQAMLSDVPWMVGWYAGLPCGWLPLHPDELPEVQSHTPVSGVLLSPSILGLKEVSPLWQQIYVGQRPLPGFTRVSLDETPGWVLFIPQAMP